jgi:hypothetical protein
MQKTEDRRFLLGQAEFGPLGVDQVLRRRPEGIGPDPEFGVCARLVLPELRPDAGEQHDEAEGFADIVVRPRIEPLDRVGVGVVRRQHHDRTAKAVAPQSPDSLAAVEVGQADVHDHDVRVQFRDRRERRPGASRSFDLELRMKGKLFGERAAEVGVVVHDQDSPRLCHASSLAAEPPRG